MASNNATRIAELRGMVESMRTRIDELTAEIERLVEEDEREAEELTVYENDLQAAVEAFNMLMTITDAGTTKQTALPYVSGMIVQAGLLYNVGGVVKRAEQGGIDDVAFSDVD